ncbi:MAG: OmpA family protein [Treponema sp.]|nr:OmpA family protein [Treponema sp.]
MKNIFRKTLYVSLIAFSLFNLSAQKKKAQTKESLRTSAATTTKSPEAKNAVDKLKKNPGQKKVEEALVYNIDFVKGEELFQLNRPKSAITYFEKALEAEGVDPKVYIYLGICYYQIEEYDKSLAVCVQGMAKENTDKKILAYNAGNSCYAMGNYMRADASYAIALREDENYSPAVLNRANAQLKLDHLGDARENYIKYLELEKESPQKEKIEEIIRLLDAEIERRAKEKPELINPDAFIENEAMEAPEVEEKVEVDLPVESGLATTVASELVREEKNAPALPAKREEKVPEELMKNTRAPDLPEKVESLGSQKKENLERVKTEKIAEKIEPEAILPELVGLDGEPPALPPEQLQLESVRLEKEKSAVETERVRIDEEMRRFEEERRKLEEENRRLQQAQFAAQTEKLRLEDENRRKAAEENQRIAEENRKKAQAEADALAAQKAALEEERRKFQEAQYAAQLEAQKKAFEEEKRKMEEERKAMQTRLEEEKQKLREEAQRQAEQEAMRRQMEEEIARVRAEEAEKARIAEIKRQAEEEAKKKVEEEARIKAEAEAAKKAEEEARVKAEAEAKKAEEEAKKAEAEAKKAEEEKKAEAEKQAKMAKWPAPSVDLKIKGNDRFTPDGDGLNDKVIFTSSVNYLEEEPESWQFQIYDPNGNPFKKFSGKGKPPAEIEWNGKGDNGEIVVSKNTYRAELSVHPSAKDRNRTGKSELKSSSEIHTGLLLEVIVPGHEWKIVVQSIAFDPNGPDFNKISSELKKSNSQTLDEVADEIRQHNGSNVKIVIEGYANNISGTEKEQVNELLPLSQKRAQTIVDELVKRGIDPKILTPKGLGGANPIASKEDHENWWKNRRVEFRITQ